MKFRNFAILTAVIVSLGIALPAFAEDNKPAINVTVQAQPAIALLKAGQPILMRVMLANGLSQSIRFTTFATKPNEWNGETMNVNLVDIYRYGEKRNFYYARPEIQVPQTVSGPSSLEIVPGGSLSIMVDISKWSIQGGWLKGEYELVFRIDSISVDDKITLSVLGEPVHIRIQ